MSWLHEMRVLCSQLQLKTSMSRPGITAIDVVRAYVALLKQRRYPGPQNLRLQLGTGSYTTIAKHVRALALRQAARTPPATDAGR